MGPDLSVERCRTPHCAPGRRGRVPLGIVVHTNVGSFESTVAWFADPASRVSSHYLVGLDGRVVQFVEEADTAWYAGALRLIRRRQTDEAVHDMSQLSATARRKGWRLCALYAEELIALAKAAAGDGPGAMTAWAKAYELHSGNVALNPRRTAMYKRVRVA